MMATRYRLLTTAMLLGASFSARAESPWVAEAGKLTISETYVSDSFRNYRPGALHRKLPVSYDQNTFVTTMEYGISDRLTFDLQAGFTNADFRHNTTSGAMDSVLGVRYKAFSGERWVVTLRGAAIIKGNYDVTTVGNWSAGDGASGGMGSVLFGAALPKRFFTFTETGYRIRQNPVPQDFFGTAGFGHFYKGLTMTVDYQTSRSINGVDISGNLPKYNPPFFVAKLFPATKKIFGAGDASVTYGFKGGFFMGASFSKIFHGRNVGLKTVWAGTIGWTLPGKGPHL